MMENDYKNMFHDLGVYRNVDLGIYSSALDYALNNDSIRNVAITGLYGSGKSSILESYKKATNTENKFIHISLAKFYNEKLKEDEDSIEEKANKRIDSLEARILTQLIHKVEPSVLTGTRFKIKKDINKEEWSKNIIYCVIGIVLLIMNIKYEHWLYLMTQLSLELKCLEFLFSFLKTQVFQLITLLILCWYAYIYCKRQSNGHDGI